MSAAAGVSVVIPAFNAANTIAETIASALSQSCAADQIIVVDDGSTDATAAILAGMAAQESRLRVFHQQNAGPMIARNRAIAAAGGRYIAPLDADDIWHPEYLQTIIDALERSMPPAGFAYAQYRSIDQEGRILRDGTNFAVAGSAFHRHLLVNFVGSGSNAVFRRSALDEAGGYDARARSWGGAEDYLLQLRIASRWPVAHVERRLVGYRRMPDSLSSAPDGVRRARLSALGQMRADGFPVPAAIRRWAEADAARTLAASLLRHRYGRAALGWGVRALLADPVATLGELGQRIANRVAAARNRDQAVGAGLPFLAMDPDHAIGGKPDAILQRRLLRLERLDRLAVQPPVPAS